MTTAADIAATLEKARPQSGGGFTACCPAHDDSEPSLSIADGDKGPVVHCHAGCTQDEVLDAIAARGVDLRKPNGSGNGHVAFNVEELGFVKNLPRSMLASCGVTDQRMDDGATIVGFEYRNAADEVTGVKFRRALAGNRGFFWRKGSTPSLYGLWRVEAMRAIDNRFVICEGETDALTLWKHDFSALGLPGASMWREHWLAEIPTDATVYVIVEPDRGGEAVEAWLAKSALKSRAKLVRMPKEFKDPSALHINSPDLFTERFEKLLTDAVSFGQKEARKSRFRSAADIVAHPIPAHWLLRPYLEQMVVALLYGELGTLKSFVTLDMLLAISTGQPWGGSQFPVKKQPVAYVSAEGRGLEKRLRAWAIQHNVSLANSEFFALERAIDLSTPEKVIDLAEDIAALKIVPAIIAVDTLSRNKGPLDENDTSEMATLLSMLDLHLRQRFGCTVLLVHHTGHAAKDRGRGSYTLMADTDANYRIERPDPAELTIKISTGRLKDAESPAPLFLKARIVDLGTKDEDGESETSLVLLPTDEKPIDKKRLPTGKQQMALLRLLEKEHVEGRNTWTISEMRELARHRLGMAKQTAYDAANSLINNGFIKASLGGNVLADPPTNRGDL